MKIVEPKVFLIAETQFTDFRSQDGVPVIKWLESIEGTECLAHVDGTHAEQLVELAARRCYKSFKPGLNPNIKKVRTDSADYHRNVLSMRHGSVLAHATCTFAFEFVSRVFTHELVRNAIGNAFSQESLRYVRLTDLGFRVPECVAKNAEALEIFKNTISILEGCQRQLASVFSIDEMTNFNEKKILTSAFRRIAPIGLATGIVATFNFRSLRWLMEQRTQMFAEEEIKDVMDMVAEIATKRWPLVFGDFSKNENGEWVPEFSKV